MCTRGPGHIKASPVSVKRMRNGKRDFLTYTQEILQPYLQTHLTIEDARQCAENICGFFDVLKN